MMDKETLIRQIENATLPPCPQRKDWRIGCVGAGFIMKECQLKAYRDMGFNPYGLTSLNREVSEAVAKEYDIPHVYDTWQEMVADPEIEILDIATPPDVQVEIVREAVKQKHLRGILCQKPLAMSLEDAREVATLCQEAGIPMAVNSNMRYDQSMRAHAHVLDVLFGEARLVQHLPRGVRHVAHHHLNRPRAQGGHVMVRQELIIFVDDARGDIGTAEVNAKVVFHGEILPPSLKITRPPFSAHRPQMLWHGGCRPRPDAR